MTPKAMRATDSIPVPSRPVSFKTPLGLTVLTAVCIGLPIIMMVENTDRKINDLTSESAALGVENGMLGKAVAAERQKYLATRTELAKVVTHRDDLLVKLENAELRETSLYQVVDSLREEVETAHSEAKLMAAAWQRDARQMKELVSNSEETAYSLLQENRELKDSIRARDGSMVSLLGEVSSLNTELAYLKDERDEMNREILRITAQVRTLETGNDAEFIRAVDARR